MDEGHPNWPTLSTLFLKWSVSDLLRTEFSKKEIDSARWLEIGAWHHGYPQPDEDIFGYRQATYDLTDWCKPCGIGMKQQAPFQMKGEPKWGRHGILQLIWIYDELFVTPEVWASVFKPHGIRCRPVMNTKGAELRTVVQLVIEEEVGIVTEGLPLERRRGWTRRPQRQTLGRRLGPWSRNEARRERKQRRREDRAERRRPWQALSRQPSGTRLPCGADHVPILQMTYLPELCIVRVPIYQ